MQVVAEAEQRLASLHSEREKVVLPSCIQAPPQLLLFFVKYATDEKLERNLGRKVYCIITLSRPLGSSVAQSGVHTSLDYPSGASIDGFHNLFHHRNWRAKVS